MNVDVHELVRRLEAIENNVNANTATLMAVTAILARIPAVANLAANDAKAIASASARHQESLSQLLNATHSIIDTLLTNAKMNQDR